MHTPCNWEEFILLKLRSRTLSEGRALKIGIVVKSFPAIFRTRNFFNLSKP